MADDKKLKKLQEAKRMADEATEHLRKIERDTGVSADDLPGDGLAKAAGSAIQRRQKKRESLMDDL